MSRRAVRALLIAVVVGACGRTAFVGDGAPAPGPGPAPTPSGSGFTSPTPPSGFDAWTHRRHVAVIGTGLAETLTNFPVPVALTHEVASAAPGGIDLRFFDENGVGIPYEIEEWSAAQQVIWVGLPSLKAGTGAGFWMYYGNAAAPSAQNAVGVFTDFAAVWHLDTSLRASTGTVNDLAGNAADAAGIFGRGRSFDGSTSVLSAADNASLNPTAAITVSAWVNALDWNSGNRRIVQKGDNDEQYRFIRSNGPLELQVTNAGLVDLNALPPLNQWHYVAATYSGSQAKVYIDGATTQTANFSGSIPVSASDLHIGAKIVGGVAGDHFLGRIDEVRVSPAARSAGWLRAEWLAGQPGMVVVGPEQSR